MKISIDLRSVSASKKVKLTPASSIGELKKPYWRKYLKMLETGNVAKFGTDEDGSAIQFMELINDAKGIPNYVVYSEIKGNHFVEYSSSGGGSITTNLIKVTNSGDFELSTTFLIDSKFELIVGTVDDDDGEEYTVFKIDGKDVSLQQAKALVAKAKTLHYFESARGNKIKWTSEVPENSDSLFLENSKGRSGYMDTLAKFKKFFRTYTFADSVA
jgi:hypothetical protein